MRLSRLALTCLVAAGMAVPAFPLNIVITNDDGCEASTVFALQKALTADGHSAIICAPFGNNSGGGGKLDFLTPFTPVTAASQSGLIPAGSAGAGNFRLLIPKTRMPP